MVYSQENTGVQITGAAAIIKTLECLGVTDIFGMPGSYSAGFWPFYTIQSWTIFLVRHEQGAGHAAQGYAISTGKVGCCIVTSKLGAANIVTAIADAAMDSVLLLCITGQVSADMIGTDAFKK